MIENPTPTRLSEEENSPRFTATYEDGIRRLMPTAEEIASVVSDPVQPHEAEPLYIKAYACAFRLAEQISQQYGDKKGLPVEPIEPVIPNMRIVRELQPMLIPLATLSVIYDDPNIQTKIQYLRTVLNSYTHTPGEEPFDHYGVIKAVHQLGLAGSGMGFSEAGLQNIEKFARTEVAAARKLHELAAEQGIQPYSIPKIQTIATAQDKLVFAKSYFEIIQIRERMKRMAFRNSQHFKSLVASDVLNERSLPAVPELDERENYLYTIYYLKHYTAKMAAYGAPTDSERIQMIKDMPDFRGSEIVVKIPTQSSGAVRILRDLQNRTVANFRIMRNLGGKSFAELKYLGDGIREYGRVVQAATPWEKALRLSFGANRFDELVVYWQQPYVSSALGFFLYESERAGTVTNSGINHCIELLSKYPPSWLEVSPMAIYALNAIVDQEITLLRQKQTL